MAGLVTAALIGGINKLTERANQYAKAAVIDPRQVARTNTQKPRV